MPVWPTDLPQCPILGSFAEQKQRNVVVFQPEVGPPKMRKRSTAASWLTEVAYRMTKAQLTSFYTFYETTLQDGSLTFIWAHPITKTNYDWAFDSRDAPKAQRTAPAVFLVTFNLLRLPP